MVSGYPSDVSPRAAHESQWLVGVPSGSWVVGTVLDPSQSALGGGSPSMSVVVKDVFVCMLGVAAGRFASARAACHCGAAGEPAQSGMIAERSPDTVAQHGSVADVAP